MIPETSDDDLLRATQGQDQLFARSWWQASPETAGALRHLWSATLTRLTQGDCLRNEALARGLTAGGVDYPRLSR